MSNRIYPIEWKGTHPYTSSDPSDLYYTKIANRVQNALVSCQFNKILDEEMIKRVALALTSWFEDIISDIGIWRAFTTECKRRYGTYLPFYDTSEDNYYPDEINLSDVQFLLWHYVQHTRMKTSLVNPENIGLFLIAEAVYEIFDQEYEEAPINQTLYNFFGDLEVNSNSFYHLRNIMEWFCYYSYLNIWNEDDLFDRTKDFFDSQEIDKGDARYVEVMTYSIRLDYTFSARNLLSFTSYQWLSMIINDPVKKELLNNIIYKQYEGIYVESADDEYVYAREAGVDGKPLKITIKSFDPQNLKIYLGNAALVSLVYFDEVWWISGTILPVSANKLEESRAEDKKIEEMIKDANEIFIEKTKGKRMFFFKNTDEYEKFACKKLGFKSDKLNLYPPEIENEDLFVCSTPKVGVYTKPDICSWLKHPDNPMYNHNEAKENAFKMLFDIDIPYQVATLMIDEGLFADAKMVSQKGEEYGRKLLQDNIYFLNDYIRKACRDIDYVE